MIEQVKPTPNDRLFIRFSVLRVPEVGLSGEKMFYGGQWQFRAHMTLGGIMFCVDWYQPESEKEPAPDDRLFFPAMRALLKRSQA